MVATEAPSAPSDADGCGAAPPDASERAHHVRPAAPRAAPAWWRSGCSISSAFVSLAGKTHALFTGLSLEGLVTLDLEYVPHQLQALGIVFHDQDQFIRHDAPGS